MSSVSVFRGVDFTGTDWGERNIDIAARLGVEPGLIAAARRHFDMVMHPHPDWSDVDFSRPLADIAAELGVSTASVSKAKRAMGLQRERIDWSGADWSKSDMELAEEYGCTTPSVWYARRVHGGGQATARKLGRTRLERVGENGTAQSPEQTREEWMKGMLDRAHEATREKGRKARRVYFTDKVINRFAEKIGLPRQRVASRFLDDGVIDWMLRSVDQIKPILMRETSVLLSGRVSDAVNAIEFYYRGIGGLRTVDLYAGGAK